MTSIEICDSDIEEVLIQKANIHRSRLARFGRSKMNNINYYRGPRGGVFIYTSTGKKKYI